MTRRAYVVALVAALALAGAVVVLIWTSNRLDGLTGEGVGTVLDPPVDVRDVRLVDVEGRSVTLGELAPTLLVFFGYTSCPDVCPLTLATLADAYARAFQPGFRGYGARRRSRPMRRTASSSASSRSRTAPSRTPTSSSSSRTAA